MDEQNYPTVEEFQAMSLQERAEFLYEAKLTGTELQRTYAQSIPQEEGIVVALLWQKLCDRDGVPPLNLQTDDVPDSIRDKVRIPDKIRARISFVPPKPPHEPSAEERGRSTDV